MATSYEKIYERVFPKFKDFDIPLMEEKDVEIMFHNYLSSSISMFYNCKKDLSDRDEILLQFNQDLDNDEIEILSNYMVIIFLDSNYIRVPTILKANLSSSDFNAFSPANFLKELTAMRKVYLTENETILMRYSWKK